VNATLREGYAGQIVSVLTVKISILLNIQTRTVLKKVVNVQNQNAKKIIVNVFKRDRRVDRNVAV
jgi:hypothetical protein